MASSGPRVSVIVGSTSDADQIASCRQVLERLGITHEARVLSAHRTPQELVSYVEALEERGVEVVIAAAGMAAHLAGVAAAHTRLPVLGVPMVSGSLAGIDALLSTVQMPPGVPVGSLGVGSAGATNAAYLAARILALHDDELAGRLADLAESDRARIVASELPDTP